jgi:hypothetical protein
MPLGGPISLEIAGLGIVFYSPTVMSGVPEGTDYFSDHFTTEEQVQAHIQQGSMVAFGTGTPGRFILQFDEGYPSEPELAASDFKLRLGIRCTGGVLCFRDLYDLLDWAPACPLQQQLSLPDGIYHVTLCSNTPASGILGDDQTIRVYLNRLRQFPKLARQGIPTLCM